ncbi:hypothetical protein TNIN_334351 [Trichonephila inaurata madagascariensis]|uniref:Uncharacterized protein n=1 Tax=Trichonephila inaurata madagascariensis TaxID=2747483 RepID=A0A8X6XUW8_9ARAC|nr:hypothetical protein TNIN_334351 [Trichonephila inaurata madagascariensis]
MSPGSAQIHFAQRVLSETMPRGDRSRCHISKKHQKTSESKHSVRFNATTVFWACDCHRTAVPYPSQDMVKEWLSCGDLQASCYLIRCSFFSANGSTFLRIGKSTADLGSISILPLRNLANNLRTVHSLVVRAPHVLLILANVAAAECRRNRVKSGFTLIVAP